MKKKTAGTILSLVLTAQMLTGCGSSGEESTADGAAGAQTESSSETSEAGVESDNADIVKNDAAGDSAQHGTITIAGTDPSSLDLFDTQTATNAYLWSVYEPLYDADSEANLVSVLADASRGEFGGYDHEEGTNKYTVYIYDYIYDSQGNHITADDVVFSYEARMASGEATNSDAWDHAEAVDETTVDFYFDREMNLVGDLNEYFTRTLVFSQKAYEESASNLMAETVGTGRYNVTDYSAGLSMTLEKRDDYWQTDESLISQKHKANVDKIVYQFIDEEAQKVIALETGTVDVVESLGVNSLGDFQSGGEYDEKYDIYSYPDNLSSYLGANCSEESIMSDINMRLAVFYAVSADGVASSLGQGAANMVGTVGNQKYNGYNMAWDSADDYQSKTDADLVKEYLDAAGYNGETVKILAAEMLDSKTSCEVIQQMLLNAGINCEISVLDYATFLTKRDTPAEWDIMFDYMAGGNTYLVSVWKNVYLTNASVFGIDGDTKLNEMMNNILTVEGNTSENVEEFRNYIIEQAYSMGLCVKYANIVYTTDITGFAMNDMNAILPGGCTYAN